jgi:hypothetical protein
MAARAVSQTDKIEITLYPQLPSRKPDSPRAEQGAAAAFARSVSAPSVATVEIKPCASIEGEDHSNEGPAVKRYLELSEQYPGYARQCPNWAAQYVHEYMGRLKTSRAVVQRIEQQGSQAAAAANAFRPSERQIKIAQGYAVDRILDLEEKQRLREREDQVRRNNIESSLFGTYYHY